MKDNLKNKVPREGFSVAASPLNGVKFDLGVILFIGLLLLLVVDRITHVRIAQLGLLGGYGIIGLIWVVVRTRRILLRYVEKRGGDA